jgi:hypothetical protein
MRVLEARFHPSSKSGRNIVSVGRVICTAGRVTIESVEVPPAAVRPFDASRLREKLAFLVTSFAQDTCVGLLQLRSEFWSFVEVEAVTPPDGPHVA